MTRLPYDDARCAVPCRELKHRCARAQALGRPDGPQAYDHYPGGESCRGFIDTKEKNDG